MLNFKIVFVIGLAVPCFTHSILDLDHSKSGEDKTKEVQDVSHEVEDISQNHEHSSNEDLLRINWGPVWDDIEGTDEFITRSSDGKDKCSTPNGKGLQNLFEESLKLLPIQGIKEIAANYANDPQVKALKDYVQSTDFEQKIKAIKNSEEYKMFAAYACHVLHIDVANKHELQESLIRTNQEAGIKGLLNKIHSIVPHQKLKELYNSLMRTDDELVKAVAHLQSQEFKQMLLNVRNNIPAHKELMAKLRDIGVPIEELRGMIGYVLDWNLDVLS